MTQSCPPQPQVSVIVPVYNQERYLEECISSIRRQTLAEWECLIINDGSSDSSGEIARRFLEADSRIRYFEQENGGVSSARNLGMQRASGRYLCFVDGDDFIDAAFLKHLLDASDRGASDLTVAGKLFCDRFPPDKIPALPGAVLSDHHGFMQGRRYIDPFHFSPPDRAYQAGKTAGLLLPLLSARQEPPKEQECPKTRPEP